MGGHRKWTARLCPLAAAALLLGPPPAGAAQPEGKGVAPLDAAALAAKIDQHLAARWDQARVKPAAPSDDAEFLRRASLDLAGKVPPASEVRRFLDDKSPDKRQRLVERLLDSPGYVSHFTNVWRAMALPETGNFFEQRYVQPGFEAWLRKHFSENTPYDRMVRDLLTAKIGSDRRQSFVDIYTPAAEPTALGFYFANEYKPENLGARTARLFLGIRIECAQCHDHPFAKWKRDQFWGYAAFFAGLQRNERDGRFGPVRELPDRRELAVPNKDQVVQAAFLDGTEPRWQFQVGARTTLAEWATHPDNPYFAKATANRLWAHFFGTGLVDPVDDLGGEGEPSHPGLLDELARQFVAHQFDLKYLMRAIAASRAYQLTSETKSDMPADPRLFARMIVRGLSPEQLFDSVAQATGFRDRQPTNPQDFFANTTRTEFLAKFANQADKRTETQTSIPQALALMNGKLVGDATNLGRSATLAAVADAPFLDTAGRVEALYLATLSRKPRAEELEGLVKYVDGGGPLDDPKKALADVFWVLLNSSEFIFNH